jgi:hypothetical protein
MALGKPDITKFDSDDDSIKDARPEMQTAFTSLNTIIDEYNAGTLAGANIDLPEEVYAAPANNPFTTSGTAVIDPRKITVLRKIGSNTGINMQISLSTQGPSQYSDSAGDPELERNKKCYIVCIDDGDSGATVDWRLNIAHQQDDTDGVATIKNKITSGNGATFVFVAYHINIDGTDSAGGYEGLFIADIIEGGFPITYG